jgi:hypothetical protein
VLLSMHLLVSFIWIDVAISNLVCQLNDIFMSNFHVFRKPELF